MPFCWHFLFHAKIVLTLVLCIYCWNSGYFNVYELASTTSSLSALQTFLKEKNWNLELINIMPQMLLIDFNLFWTQNIHLWCHLIVWNHHELLSIWFFISIWRLSGYSASGVCPRFMLNLKYTELHKRHKKYL